MSYQFFQNRNCEYFPCHRASGREDAFSCLFCYCPLYAHADCGGNYTILKNGVKDCSECTIPHFCYDRIVQRLCRNNREESKKMPEIKVKYHEKALQKIEKIEQGDWIDLRAAERIELHQGDFRMISLGISVQLPSGYEAHIAPRSSTFKKWGILQVNSVGVVDESYCGENDVWRMPVYATRDTVIEQNDRVCQFRIVKKMEALTITQVDRLEGKDRGGFGSTGSR
ncbi:MAG: cysteine-rich small domain-containing protein [Acutalibacteraceae bacterium]